MGNFVVKNNMFWSLSIKWVKVLVAQKLFSLLYIYIYIYIIYQNFNLCSNFSRLHLPKSINFSFT
ncbi:MAG: hypothetical protein MCS20_01355 [Candidatus Phytoplasma mali]|nr:hypothetical protein [Candidatus Phytoplasma mali]